MKHILVLGAGKSTSSLIKYLSLFSQQLQWKITVADQSEALVAEKIRGHANTHAAKFDGSDQENRASTISSADLVISMLPPFMHALIARDCIRFGKPLLTASYLSEEIAGMDQEAKEKGVPILMEMGLDPGIDHMSAMKELDLIHEEGGDVVSFKSYTGGLIAPTSDTNPWHYKITWNPRNVILAGQGTVKYLSGGTYKYIPYQSVFSRLHHLQVDGYGAFEGYANRDSLKYMETYKLAGAKTFIRGTLRRPGYCSSWNALVRTGLTDDSFVIENTQGLAYRDFLEMFLPEINQSIKKSFCENAGIATDSAEANNIEWLGLFGPEKIVRKSGSPAQILQEIIEKKWALEEGDQDMIVMQHEFIVQQKGVHKKITSTLVEVGEDRQYTAMAKTVGLPLAIATKLLLTDQLKLSGVHIPLQKEIYLPILQELEQYGIRFKTVEEDPTDINSNV